MKFPFRQVDKKRDNYSQQINYKNGLNKQMNKIYTLTMADLYYKQEYYNKAKKAYLFLAGQAPDDKNLIDKIKRLYSFGTKDDDKKCKKNLAPLFDKWLSMNLQINKVKHMKMLQKHISGNVAKTKK